MISITEVRRAHLPSGAQLVVALEQLDGKGPVILLGLERAVGGSKQLRIFPESWPTLAEALDAQRAGNSYEEIAYGPRDEMRFSVVKGLIRIERVIGGEVRSRREVRADEAVAVREALHLCRGYSS